MIKAMILAAGQGLRMRELTRSKPKPLLTLNDKTLIEHQIQSLANCGIESIVINIAYLGQQIIDHIGFGDRWGITIEYSWEKTGHLDVGGGIRQALPLLSDPFFVLSADVISDYDFKKLLNRPLQHSLAHLVLVANPEYHRWGDFSLSEGVVGYEGSRKWTFSGIGIYKKELFQQYQTGQNITLTQILDSAQHAGQITGEIYNGLCYDVGTPERLKAAQSQW